MLTGRVSVVRGTAAAALHFVMKRLPALLRREPFWSHHLETRSFTKPSRPFPCKEYMLGLFHYSTCRKNGIARPTNSRNRAACTCCTIHDGGIHLMRFIRRENSPATGVEQRIFFQSND